MSDNKLLLTALKARKEQKKTRLEKIHDWANSVSNLFGGVDSGYKASTSAIDLDKSAISSTAQSGLSITSLTIMIITAIPQLIAIYSSKRPLLDKILDSLPLLLLSAIGITATVLGIWFLAQVIVGTGLIVAAASLAVGLSLYNLFKAYASKWSIGTKYEGKVDSLTGIYDALFGEEPTAADLPTKEKLLAQLKKQLAKLDEDQIAQLVENYKNPTITDKFINFFKPLIKPDTETQDPKIKTIDKLINTLDQLISLDCQNQDPQSKLDLANENILAAWVTLGFSVAGLLLATIGLIAVLGAVGFPPAWALTLGILALSLTAVGLFKFALELKFSWDEQNVKEKKLDNKLEAYLNEASHELNPEKNNQILPVPELTHIDQNIVKKSEPIPIPGKEKTEHFIDVQKNTEIQKHIKEGIKHYYDKPQKTQNQSRLVKFFKNAVKPERDNDEGSEEKTHVDNQG